jgi:uncharacterized protein with PIN domain
MSDLPEIPGYVATGDAVEVVVKLKEEIRRLQAVVDAVLEMARAKGFPELHQAMYRAVELARAMGGEVKPCPRCGGSKTISQVVKRIVGRKVTEEKVTVRCPNCGEVKL